MVVLHCIDYPCRFAAAGSERGRAADPSLTERTRKYHQVAAGTVGE